MSGPNYFGDFKYQKLKLEDKIKESDRDNYLYEQEMKLKEQNEIEKKKIEQNKESLKLAEHDMEQNRLLKERELEAQERFNRIKEMDLEYRQQEYEATRSAIEMQTKAIQEQNFLMYATDEERKEYIKMKLEEEQERIKVEQETEKEIKKKQNIENKCSKFIDKFYSSVYNVRDNYYGLITNRVDKESYNNDLFMLFVSAALFIGMGWVASQDTKIPIHIYLTIFFAVIILRYIIKTKIRNNKADNPEYNDKYNKLDTIFNTLKNMKSDLKRTDDYFEFINKCINTLYFIEKEYNKNKDWAFDDLDETEFTTEIINTMEELNNMI